MSMNNANDWFESNSHSDCCGAAVINPADDKMGICSDCHEWCEITVENEQN